MARRRSWSIVLLSAPATFACTPVEPVTQSSVPAMACSVTGKVAVLTNEAQVCAIFAEAMAAADAPATPEDARLAVTAPSDRAAEAELVAANGTVLLTMQFSIAGKAIDQAAWRIFARDFAAEWGRIAGTAPK